MTRRAVIVNARDARQVTAYLPDNYRVICSTGYGADGMPLDRPGLLIEGADVAGWTLDGYVLPRLASGLMYGAEVLA